MLDARLVADNPDLISENLARRNADEATLAIPTRIAELSETRNRLLQAAEAGRATRNQLSPQIGQMMKAGQREEAEALKAEVRRASEAVKESESALTAVEEERTTLLMSLPNLLHGVSRRQGEHENVEVRRWGAPPDMSLEPKPHDELAAELTLDQGRALESPRTQSFMAAWRPGEALINFFIDTHPRTRLPRSHGALCGVARGDGGDGPAPKFEEDASTCCAPQCKTPFSFRPLRSL